jgi:formylglycine-generating enzyme required for sulfatase activity
MYLLPSRSVTTSPDAVEVRLPAPVALPGRLRLGRALRTLKRKRPAARRTEFDLDATIELYGNTGLLMPLLRRGTERWFDVTLVVDTGPTMDVWAQTTAELAKLLAGQGTFRRVRRLRLTVAGGSPSLLTDTGRHLHPHRLRDPEGRQLIMVVTDCVSPAWYGSQVWPAIREWGRHGPVVLVQPLPQRLWESTALGPTDARLTSYRPAQPNHGLRVTWPWWLADEDERTDVTPVVALTDKDLASWARMVMGGADSPVAGALTEPADTEPLPLPALSPVERVAAFKSTVSTEAYQLAVCLSAVPIRLPVARIVQYSMLHTQSLVPLAEVFAGGLLQRMTLAEEDLPPDEVDYDFVDGVREILQSALTGTQTLSIFRAVARYLESTIGAGVSFAALLAGAEGDGELDPRFRPFAEVSTKLMDRLGLRSRPTPPKKVQPLRQPLPPLLWEHAILVGNDPGIDRFRDWLMIGGGLPEGAITVFRNDGMSDRPILDTITSPRTGLLFVLAIGNSTRQIASLLEEQMSDCAPVVVVTLTGSPSSSDIFSRGKQQIVNLEYTGPSISDVIEALSGAAVDGAGAITVLTFDAFMLERVSSRRVSTIRSAGNVVLRHGPLASVGRRRALVIGMGPGERGAQLVANRLTALGYSVAPLIGSKGRTGHSVLDTITSLAETARRDDLFWLHIAGGRTDTDSDHPTLAIPGEAPGVDLVSLRTFGQRCGSRIIITEELILTPQQKITRVLIRHTDTEPAFQPATDLISIFSAGASLHPMLLDLLVHRPTASLGELAEHFRNDSTVRIETRGALTASIAADRHRDDPLQDIELVRVPGGDFYTGLTPDQWRDLGQQGHSGGALNLPTFSISRFPITNAQYDQFIKATGRKTVPAYWNIEPSFQDILDHPVVAVRHGTAMAYCNWLAETTGLPFRLPTALEWEKAARGTDGRKFPWGNEFDASRASHWRRSTVSVKAFSPAGDSPYGVADTVGNVREWTSTTVPRRNVPNEGTTKIVVVCGGGMLANEERLLWCNHQTSITEVPRATVGFRVALSLEA